MTDHQAPAAPMPPRDWLRKHTAPSQGSAGHGWQTGWQAGYEVAFAVAATKLRRMYREPEQPASARDDWLAGYRSGYRVALRNLAHELGVDLDG